MTTGKGLSLFPGLLEHPRHTIYASDYPSGFVLFPQENTSYFLIALMKHSVPVADG